jgi:hypothetical protein
VEYKIIYFTIIYLNITAFGDARQGLGASIFKVEEFILLS